MVINLNKFRTEGSSLFSGRDRGEKVREELNLAEKDEKGESYEVLVPSDIDSINASFFLGLFGDSVRKLGEVEFRRRYQFKCDNIIRKNVEDGISRSLKESNPLRR